MKKKEILLTQKFLSGKYTNIVNKTRKEINLGGNYYEKMNKDFSISNGSNHFSNINTYER